MKGRIAESVEEILQECVDMHRWNIEELNVQIDHVHMVVQLRPDISISKVVQLFKGKSSKIIREEFPELREFFWGKSFWCDGYFVETVGKVNLDTIKAYVQNQ